MSNSLEKIDKIEIVQEEENEEKEFIENKTKNTPEIERLGLELALLCSNDRIKLLKIMFDNLPKKEKEKILDALFSSYREDTYWKIVQALEDLYLADYSIKPSVAAEYIKHYHRIPHKMTPLLRVLARRVKDKIRKRNKAKSYTKVDKE